MKRMTAKLVYIGVVAFLVVGLLIVGYAQQAYTAKKIFRTEVRTTGFGGICYVMGFANADILNKKSSWVRCSPLESTGSTENIKSVGHDPKKRKRTFFTTGYGMYLRALAGESPMNDKPELYKDLMPIRASEKIGFVMYTLDPTIKTVKDLKGKTVGTWGKGTMKFFETQSYIGLKDVIDSVKWAHSGYQSYDGMILGTVDAVVAFAAEVALHKYAPTPALAELIAKGKKLYIVSRTPESIKISKKVYGDGLSTPCPIRKDAIAPGLPEKGGAIAYLNPIGYSVYPEFPEDVVYEILKTTTDNWEMYKDYHPSGPAWAPENMGLFPVPKERWHPAAKKFFEERKINYGLDFFNEVYGAK